MPEFRAWRVENVIFNLLRDFCPIPMEEIRGYYLGNIRKCFGERAVSSLEMFSGGCLSGLGTTVGILY